MRKTCGNCQHFTHEPNTPSRGVCWHSAEFDYYVVRGEHYKGCDDWMERTEISETERKAAKWDGIVRCGDCKHYRDHELIPIENAPDLCVRIPYGVKVEPDGFCWRGERREDV